MIALGSVHIPDVPSVAQWRSEPRADGQVLQLLLSLNFGPGRIFGTAKLAGTPQTPVRRLVRLHDQLSGRVVAETFSNAATGEWSFEHLRVDAAYYVTAFDSTKVHNGELATDLTPEPMP